MAPFGWPSKKKLSYKEESPKLRETMDSLDFFATGANGLSTRDAFQQIHAVMHGALQDVEKSIQMVFEQLRPDGAVAERIFLEANGEINNEKARANVIADEKKDQIGRDIRARLETIYIQDLILSPHQDPAIRRWENLSTRAVPSITTSVQGGMWGDARMAARRLAWERLARSLLSCVSSSHRSNSVGPNRSRGSISRTTR